MVKTDEKNGAITRAQRGTFLHHEYEIQYVFQASAYLLSENCMLEL